MPHSVCGLCDHVGWIVNSRIGCQVTEWHVSWGDKTARDSNQRELINNRGLSLQECLVSAFASPPYISFLDFPSCPIKVATNMVARCEQVFFAGSDLRSIGFVHTLAQSEETLFKITTNSLFIFSLWNAFFLVKVFFSVSFLRRTNLRAMANRKWPTSGSASIFFPPRRHFSSLRWHFAELLMSDQTFEDPTN